MGRTRVYSRSAVCFLCGKSFERYPGKQKGLHTFCSKECRVANLNGTPRNSKTLTENRGVQEFRCFLCGVSFRRAKSSCKGSRSFCSNACRNKQLGLDNKHNRVNQKGGLTSQEKAKISKARKSMLTVSRYEKTGSRHTHRIVMEAKLGRPLRKGEIVHHIDLDSRNNDPDNLQLFANQKEHLAWHHENDARYIKGAPSHV